MLESSLIFLKIFLNFNFFETRGGVIKSRNRQESKPKAAKYLLSVTQTKSIVDFSLKKKSILSTNNNVLSGGRGRVENSIAVVKLFIFIINPLTFGAATKVVHNKDIEYEPYEQHT